MANRYVMRPVRPLGHRCTCFGALRDISCISAAALSDWRAFCSWVVPVASFTSFRWVDSYLSALLGAGLSSEHFKAAAEQKEVAKDDADANIAAKYYVNQVTICCWPAVCSVSISFICQHGAVLGMAVMAKAVVSRMHFGVAGCTVG